MSRDSKLPLLDQHDDALQKCVYCPKLCRGACPVSNVEANESVTPWGKMSMAYFAGRGDVPSDAEHAALAWACTGCLGCREVCEHDNEVASVLGSARAEYFSRGVAPKAATEFARRYDAHSRVTADAVAALDREPAEAPRVALLLGCDYARHHRDEAAAAWRVAQRMAAREDRQVRAVRVCCGLPLLYAGDRAGFERAARTLERSVDDVEELWVLDPGCARTVMHAYPQVGVELRAKLLLDVLTARIEELPAGALRDRRFRYHDPCQLGRGLGRYEEPRALLARITGAPPESFPRHRAQGECSGAGGLLPLTRPDTSATIADQRIAEHREAGGGELVTACGASLRRFRSRGEAAVDLIRLVDEALDRQA
jgi:Fe-S oxidoreductase